MCEDVRLEDLSKYKETINMEGNKMEASSPAPKEVLKEKRRKDNNL